VFAHNGNLARFGEIREQLVALVPPVLRRFILGDSDSEVLFYLLLGHMARRHELHVMGYPLEDVIASVREMVGEVVELAGDPCWDDQGPPDATYLTFALTNGRTMVAHQGGKPLWWTTHKTLCPDRAHCPSFGRECEAASKGGAFVKHLVVSSETLQGVNVWTPMLPYEVVGVDWAMKLQRSSLV
jgi:glutamine amidotransferase